ncbi:hypothetical protein ACFT5C_31685, partial [Streptomyces sp. NPDC057116]|uniref:hypothetical protein n=1 Tax=Streptomyces sp. NPDC057116 TaxID=3346023 RepID=UPI00362C0725
PVLTGGRAGRVPTGRRAAPSTSAPWGTAPGAGGADGGADAAGPTGPAGPGPGGDWARRLR